jgi:hypothetical protein
MKAKTFKDIYIPNPCHENWDKMTSMEKGRFCQSCQKKVYDFRNSTFEEVKEAFKESNEEACATFYDDQINQDLKYLNKSKSPLFQRLKLSAAATLAAIWLKIFWAEESYGQQPINLMRDSIEVTFNKTPKAEHKVIHGKVLNKSTSKGLVRIQVNLKNQNRIVATAVTDHEGNFKMEIHDVYLSEELVLVTQRQKAETFAKWIITPSVSKKLDMTNPEVVILEADLIIRKKPFKKERIIRTGRYRID